MINATSPISSVIPQELLVYRAFQSEMKSTAKIVFDSLAMIINSDGNGFSVQNLEDIEAVLSQNNMQSSGAYRLTQTLIDMFDIVSSDLQNITLADLDNVVDISIVDELEKLPNLAEILNLSGVIYNGDISKQTLMNFVKSLDSIADTYNQKLEANNDKRFSTEQSDDLSFYYDLTV